MGRSRRAERSSLLVSLEHHKYFMITKKILFAVSILYERVRGQSFLLFCCCCVCSLLPTEKHLIWGPAAVREASFLISCWWRLRSAQGSVMTLKP